MRPGYCGSTGRWLTTSLHCFEVHHICIFFPCFYMLKQRTAWEMTEVSQFLLCENILGYGSFPQMGTSVLLLSISTLELFWLGHLRRVFVFYKENPPVSVFFPSPALPASCSSVELLVPGGGCTPQQHLLSSFSLGITHSSLTLGYASCY